MSRQTNDSKSSNNVIIDKDNSLGFDVDWDTIEANYKHRHRHSQHHGSNSQDAFSEDSKKASSNTKKKRRQKRKKFPSSSFSKQKKKWSKKKKVITGILLFLLCIIIGLVSASLILYFKGKSALLNYDNLNISVPENIDYKDNGSIVNYNGHTYEFNKQIASILFMGIDTRELKEDAVAGTAGQADALFLFTYNTFNGKIKILSLNRDTMTDISRYDADGNYYDTSSKQLCLAYSYGDGKELSAENQVTAVERLLYNVPINAYYAIDLSAIKVLNDDIGGVTVTPEYTFAEFTKGQQVTLKGDLAESFVRHRDISLLDDNLRRISCQRQYITAFASQIIPAIRNDLNTPLKLYEDSSKYTVTNINMSSITFLGSKLVSNYSGLEIINTEGQYYDVPGDDFAEYEVDKTKLFESILDIFYTKIN